MFQGSIWTKYAFTLKKQNIYYYFCAIPYNDFIPESFELMEVKANNYLVFEHRGEMYHIKDTINKIYKEFIPNHSYVVKKDAFFHFEKYDSRFYWNKPYSIIDIYLPIETMF